MKQEKEISLFGKKFKQSDVIKLGGLLVFIALITVIIAVLWPRLSVVFESGGAEALIDYIRNQGAFGVLILLGMQLLQIIVAFIPGEVVQVAAGMMYGPLWGSVIILVGCVISSALVYELVHKLGAPFVRSMVGEKNMQKFRNFETSGKFGTTVFILFLIPGFPKDVLTYIVPLSDMNLKTFLLISTIGRTPGVVVSTYAAAGLADGNIVTSVVLFAILALIAIIVLLLKNRIIDAISKHGKSK